MSKIKLSDLPSAIRVQVMAQYDIPQKRIRAKQVGAALSPYADRLGDALAARFPARMLREYQPIKSRRYRIDIAFPNEKLAIEFDGYRYHAFSKNGFKQGLVRQNMLVKHGWRILRYTLTDVRDHMEHVLDEIDSVLEKDRLFGD